MAKRERANKQIKIFSPNQAGQARMFKGACIGSYKFLSSVRNWQCGEDVLGCLRSKVADPPLDVTYSDLVSVLGEPTFIQEDSVLYRLPVIQWVGTIAGEPFVVNDGQESIPMFGKGEKEPEEGDEWKKGSEFEEEKYHWYVGAATEDTVDRIIDWLNLELKFSNF